MLRMWKSWALMLAVSQRGFSFGAGVLVLGLGVFLEGCLNRFCYLTGLEGFLPFSHGSFVADFLRQRRFLLRKTGCEPGSSFFFPPPPKVSGFITI